MKRRGEDASLPGCSAGRHARWHSSARARQPAMPRKRADMLISAAMRGATRAANPKRGRADPSISAAVRDATRAASARAELRRAPVGPQRVWREHVTAATAKKCVCNAHACVVRCGNARKPRAAFALGSVRSRHAHARAARKTSSDSHLCTQVRCCSWYIRKQGPQGPISYRKIYTKQGNI